MKHHLLTVIAIAVVVYAAADVLHEAVGHGGACLLVGGKPLDVSSVHFQCDAENLSRNASRWISAGGTLVNLLAGIFGWILLRKVSQVSAATRFFLWLFMSVNLMVGAGYFLFSGVLNIGDWVSIIRDLPQKTLWRVVLATFGFIFYLAVVWFSLHELGRIIGGQEPELYRRAQKLTLTAYFAGCLAVVLAGLFNPIGMLLVAISAAASSFGGTSGLAWMAGPFHMRGILKRAGPPLVVGRSNGWIITGAFSLILLVALLGPGIQFS